MKQLIGIVIVGFVFSSLSIVESQAQANRVKPPTINTSVKPKPPKKPTIPNRPFVSPSNTSSRAYETITVKGISFKMIRVEGGTFTMGATAEQGSNVGKDEKPVHPVTLSSFSIGETEVTQELWQAVMGYNPSKFKGPRRQHRPVENITIEDCMNFIYELNILTGRTFRLPTEAEWEYAARGGMKSHGYMYSGSNSAGDVAWYYDNSHNETHDVASKRANELGLYDMSGNVWEWCQDWYGPYLPSKQINPTGPSSGNNHVIRGGCWCDLTYSVSKRACNLVSNKGNSTLGLRLAL